MANKTVEYTRADTAIVVYTNTDLTEGRGEQFPLNVCLSPATASRLGKKRYIMGSDCPTKELPIYRMHGQWYGPVRVHYPTDEDDRIDGREAERAAAITRAKELGLTNQELKILGVDCPAKYT